MKCGFILLNQLQTKKQQAFQLLTVTESNCALRLILARVMHTQGRLSRTLLATEWGIAMMLCVGLGNEAQSHRP